MSDDLDIEWDEEKQKPAAEKYSHAIRRLPTDQEIAQADKSIPLGFSPGELMLAGAGAAFNKKYRGLRGEDAADDSMLMTNYPSRVGAMLPDALGSILAPARIIPQMGYAALSSLIEPGSAEERAANAIKSAAGAGLGQAVASGTIKGANALLGDLTRQGQVSKAAKEMGLDISAGDMMNSPLLRKAEEKTFASPTGRQAGQIESIMETKGADPVSQAVNRAYEMANQKVKDSASVLDDIIANNPQMSGITPRSTIAKLREIITHNPHTINNIDDVVLRDKIIDLASSPAGRIPKNMSFSELDELRRAIGPITQKIENAAKSSDNITTPYTARRWNSLFASIIDDMERWGEKSNISAEALDAHNQMKQTFKDEVLPIRNHPVAKKILDNKYERPEDILRDVTSWRNKSINSDLYDKLDPQGKDVFDALNMAQRGSREFIRPPAASQTAKPLTIGAAGALLSAPVWGPAVSSAAPMALPAALASIVGEQSLIHGLNSPAGKFILSGSPVASATELANRAAYSGLRNLTESSMDEMSRPYRATLRKLTNR